MGNMKLTDEQHRTLISMLLDAKVNCRPTEEKKYAELLDLLRNSKSVDVDLKVDHVEAAKIEPLVFSVVVESKIAQKLLDALRDAGIRQRIILDQDDFEVGIRIEFEKERDVGLCRMVTGRILFENYGAAVDSYIAQVLTESAEGLTPLGCMSEDPLPLASALLNRYHALTYPNRRIILGLAQAQAKSGTEVEIDCHPDMWSADGGIWVSAKVYVSDDAVSDAILKQGV